MNVLRGQNRLVLGGSLHWIFQGAIGTDIIARIVDKFPELNVKWLCTGKGNMIETDIDANVNYKAAYEGAMMQIEALHKIIEENKRR